MKAARGVLWTLVEYGGGEGLAFVSFLILARLLAPADFGVISLALVFVGFVQLFLVQGFADAVIQRERLDPDHCSTAFWTNLAIAAAFFLATLFLAGLAGRLFHQPELARILRWLSPLPIGTALISIHLAVLKRQLDFANFAKRAIVGIGAGGLAGIGLALAGFGVWSLVGQQLTNAVVSVVVIWRGCEWRPNFRFSRRCFAEMAGFSLDVIGSNLVAFLYKKADIALIGYAFDTYQLGCYYLVQRLLMTMGLVTQATIQSIVMPVLSRVQDDRARFREIFATTIEFLNVVWLPLVLGAGLVSPYLLPAVFGPRWALSIPLLQIMSLLAFTDPYRLYSGSALTAAGRPDAFLKLSLIQVVIALAFLVPATRLGLDAIAAADVLIAFSVIPFHMAMLRRIAGIEPIALIKRNLGSTGSALVMAAAVLALRQFAAPSLPPVAALALLVLAGALVYGAMLALLAPALVRRILGFVASALRRREEGGAAAAGGAA